MTTKMYDFEPIPPPVIVRRDGTCYRRPAPQPAKPRFSAMQLATIIWLISLGFVVVAGFAGLVAIADLQHEPRGMVVFCCLQAVSYAVFFGLFVTGIPYAIAAIVIQVFRK